ncbi:hypothetical protein WJX82_001974 [Trebouxia sp. C0006]
MPLLELVKEYLFYGLSGGAGPACYPSITGGQTNSDGPLTQGADRFSDTCTCGPGFYFEQNNDQWSEAQYDDTGAKDYLLPCQPCLDGTFKDTADRMRIMLASRTHATVHKGTFGMA